MTASHTTDLGSPPPDPLHPPDALDREAVLPSVVALRAMVLAEQFGSFSRAASELGVTQGGVSRAIKSIETLTGRRIFERSARGLAPTEAGAAYIAQVRAILARLGAATLRLASHDQSAQVLNVATLPSLGSLWLAPRLAGFAREHPEIILNVTANIGLVDFNATPIDCVIHYGSDAWPEGARSELLMEESLMPYASPVLLGEGANRLETLMRLPLIQHVHRPTAWRDWFAQVGLSHPAPSAGHRFELYQMGIGAAVGGLGATLMIPLLVADEVAAGHLVPLHSRPVPSAWRYHLVFPEGKRDSPALGRFRRWLMREARRSAGAGGREAVAPAGVVPNDRVRR